MIEPMIFGLLIGAAHGIHCWITGVKQLPNLFYTLVIYSMTFWNCWGLQ